MAKIESTTNGAATKKTFQDKGTFYLGVLIILVCLSLTVTPTKTDKVDSISLFQKTILKTKAMMFLIIFPISIDLIFLGNLTNRFS